MITEELAKEMLGKLSEARWKELIEAIRYPTSCGSVTISNLGSPITIEVDHETKQLLRNIADSLSRISTAVGYDPDSGQNVLLTSK